MLDSDSTPKLPKQVINLAGHRYGQLVVLSFAGVLNQKSQWLCLCDCSTRKTVACGDLRSGKTTSCGCHRRAALLAANITHGQTCNGQSRIYRIHADMNRRCFDPKRRDYKDYGERGITVCAGLRHFQVFREESGDPPTPKHTIDRIENNGNYSCGKCLQCLENGWPKNIRWATRKEQAQNRRPRCKSKN